MPNTLLEISTNNTAKYTSNFINNNSKETNTTAIVDCKGETTVFTKIQDSNITFVSLHKAGATIEISAQGDINTKTTFSDINNTLESLQFVISANNNDDFTSYNISNDNKTIFSNVHTANQTYLELQNKLKLVNLQIPNIRHVEIGITDSNGDNINTISDIALSIGDENITRISNGETGAVTTKVTALSSTIIINNFLNGEVQYDINNSNINTHAKSELLGSKLDLNSSGSFISFRHELSNTTALVNSTNEGISTHSLDINGTQTNAILNIQGAKTNIIKDENDQVKIVSNIKILNSKNENVFIQIDAHANGQATHTTEVNGYISKAQYKIAGAKTTLLVNGDISTHVRNSCGNNNTYKEALVTTSVEGTTRTELNTISCEDNSVLEEFITNYSNYEISHDIIIQEVQGEIEIITITPLSKAIQF